MNKIAIDVAIIPPEQTVNELILLSKKLFKKTKKEGILLDKKNCLPHITLAMGCINKKELPKIKENIQKTAAELKPLQLIAIHTEINRTPKGENVLSISIAKTPEIQKLHEKLMKALEPYFLKKITIDTVYQKPKPDEITLFWIKRYRVHSSFENFKPHITIGIGKRGKTKLPIKFTASKIAVCHLGNYCTCRKILASTKIEEKTSK